MFARFHGIHRSLPKASGRGHKSKLSTSSLDPYVRTIKSLEDDHEGVSPRSYSSTAGSASVLLSRLHSRIANRLEALARCILDLLRLHSHCVIITIIILALIFYNGIYLVRDIQDIRSDYRDINGYVPPTPEIPGVASPYKVDPIQWLIENTHEEPFYTLPRQHWKTLEATRPKAAFVSLVRNSEVGGMVYSMSQLEARFNSRKTHGYDWVFFNNEEFTDEFKAAVSNATTSRCFFELIPEKHWNTPSWIDEERFDIGREFMGTIGVGKAWLESYHHMCRWNAGLFALENRLRDYNWFWRVEPGVQFTCNINYDVFRFMQDTDMAYGFNMAILDDARSFPSLWARTRSFQRDYGDLLDPNADMRWLLQTTEEPDGIHDAPAWYRATAAADEEYNNCQFYSNFEIGSLDFFRGKEHQSYFNHLDKSGGFYYERFGDAPVHTLSVSMFLPKHRVWYFRDIGYAHGLCEQCPPHQKELTLPGDAESDSGDMQTVELKEGMGKLARHWNLLVRDFNRQRQIPSPQCGCTAKNFDVPHYKLVPMESKQVRPFHTCVRMWLGGRFLLKKQGWSRQAEIDFGGDGYGGYIITGMEANPYRATTSPAETVGHLFEGANEPIY